STAPQPETAMTDAFDDPNVVAAGGLHDVQTGNVSHYRLVKDPELGLYLNLEKPGSFAVADLRRHFGPPYDIGRTEGHPRLEDFSEAAISTLYPFALVLACLDGNAFTNRNNPELDLVRQYVPDAFATL